jgi:flagellar biogenesis protein FliO
MKLRLTLGATLLTSLCAAQGESLGTKADIVTSAPRGSSVVNGWDLVQMVVALAVVFALLKWALPKVVARMNKRLVTKAGSSISIEESASFGGGNLQIVSARGRTLLLCVSQNGVTCLADLTEQKGHKEEPAFFELVDQATEKDRIAYERINKLTS